MKIKYVFSFTKGKREILPNGQILITPKRPIYNEIDLEYFDPENHEDYKDYKPWEEHEGYYPLLVLQEVEDYLKQNLNQIISLGQDAHDMGINYIIGIHKVTNKIVVMSRHDIYLYDILVLDKITKEIIDKDLEHIDVKSKIQNDVYYD